jgi:hypothetical protein
MSGSGRPVSFSDCPLLAIFSHLPCPGCLIPALPWQHCPGSLPGQTGPVSAFMAWDPCLGSHVLGSLSWQSFPSSLFLSCSACPILLSRVLVLFCLSRSDFPVLPILFCLSCSACPFPPVPFYMSWSACAVLPVLSWLSCPCFPLLVLYIYTGSESTSAKI